MTAPNKRTTAFDVTLLVGTCIGLLGGCDVSRQAETADTPPAIISESPAESGMTADDSIRSSALEYVRRETAVQDARVAVQVVAAGWARVTVEPETDQTDPATMYLQREPGGWRVVTIGTAFAPDELDRLAVPAEVRPEG